jgi:hypothetical protein
MIYKWIRFGFGEKPNMNSPTLKNMFGTKLKVSDKLKNQINTNKL